MVLLPKLAAESVPTPVSSLALAGFVEVVQVLHADAAGVTAAMATEAQEAAAGGDHFALRPSNNAVLWLAFTKCVKELPAKSFLKVG